MATDIRMAKSPPRVLVVDDEADLRELLELTLIRMGLGVELASGVDAAKILLKTQHFDLCLTDMRMGDGDGLELVRHIHSSGADVPVGQFVSASASVRRHRRYASMKPSRSPSITPCTLPTS